MSRAWDEELAFAHELADLADTVTSAAFRSGLAVERKADGTAVTEADRTTERMLREAIERRFPTHAVLGEEDGLHGPAGAPTWIIDPIDGTNNFIAGIPVFATLIALHADGHGVVGVVSAPALASRWDGVAGGPARQDGRPIQVSSVGELRAATVSFGGLNYFARTAPDAIDRLTAGTGRQRGYGDFWQHCLVASGAIDVAVEGEVSRWDLAAVKVVVEAAGGRLTDLEGRDTDDGGTALTTNGTLHDEALAVLHGRR